MVRQAVHAVAQPLYEHGRRRIHGGNPNAVTTTADVDRAASYMRANDLGQRRWRGGSGEGRVGVTC